MGIPSCFPKSGSRTRFFLFPVGRLMAKPDRKAIIGLLEPVVEAQGYELVDLEVTGGGGDRTLRLFIDGPEGVGLEDCEAVSRVVEEVLDEHDPIPDSYSLEVSSPGIDRPLRRESDFERFAGEQVKVRTFAPVQGQRSFTGILEGREGSDVLLETPEGHKRIPWNQIAKAHVMADIE